MNSEAASDAREMLSQVARYYSGKLAAHGETPRGVDWNGPESQELRFAQLLRVVPDSADFSLNDLGCGYGALLDFMRSRFGPFEYHGFDISRDMVEAARRRHSGTSCDFTVASEPTHAADYGIASGIFNVRLAADATAWSGYIESTLEVLDRTSRRGFAFNCLTIYSDADRMRPDLHYADPCRLFDLCKRRFSRQVALLHDYGLYEFTILVRKP